MEQDKDLFDDTFNVDLTPQPSSYPYNVTASYQTPPGYITHSPEQAVYPLMTELEERQVRALSYILDEKPFVAISMEGRFIQISYRILPRTNRGFFLFLKAVRMFIRAAWQELS